jgi:hypothetical protein
MRFVGAALKTYSALVADSGVTGLPGLVMPARTTTRRPDVMARERKRGMRYDGIVGWTIVRRVGVAGGVDTVSTRRRDDRLLA